MPNIGPTFGSSLYTPSPTQVLPKAVNTLEQMHAKFVEKKSNVDLEIDQQQPGPSNAAALGLYEELLASSTFGIQKIFVNSNF